ncbi:hypothetical protein CALCODRAFT_495331 [Calocera cornea HHB12733]|uniref:Uncharacterized protein n=1 Tax=Calocera cornea HHB12733 TaxID=1353952 RepID=A0A165GHD1_9BASI|nr:hypothetical protein CALCODRAFT_495331 [Calocera cornea HHB12733]
MHALARSLASTVLRPRRVPPAAPRLAVQHTRHTHHPPAHAATAEWLAYFSEKDAALAEAQREVLELRARLERVEAAHVLSEEALGKLTAEVGRRRTDYTMLTAVELVVEAAYRNGSITADVHNAPSVIVSAITELQKDPLLVGIVEEACLKLDMRPEEAWAQLPMLYDRLAKKAGLMDALKFSSGYELVH